MITQQATGLTGVWAAFLRGEVSFPEAETRAAAPDIVASVDDDEMDRIADAGNAFVQNGNALAAVHGYELLIIALQAGIASDGQAKALRRARIRAIEAAKTALTDAPDGLLFRWALSLAQDELLGSNDDGVIGEISFHAGVLNLDPYVARRILVPKSAYDESIRLWKLRLEQRIGDRFPEMADVVRMPEPADALAAADRWLRSAIHHQRGGNCGLAIKALLQTIQARRLLGYAEADDHDVDQLVLEGLDTLDPKTQAIAYAAVLKMALQLGRRIDPARVEPLLQPSVATVIANLQLGEAYDFVIEVAQLLQISAPERALDLFAESRRLLTFGVDQTVNNFLRLELNVICSTVPAELVERLKTENDTSAGRIWLDSHPGLSDCVTACGYVLLATLSMRRCQEPDGRACLARINEGFPDFAQHHRPALDQLDVDLIDGWAVDARDAGAYGEAIRRFGDAVTVAVRAGLIEQAFSELAFIEQVVLQHRTADALDAAAQVLSEAGLILQAAAGDRALWSVVTLAHAVLSMSLDRADTATATITRLVQTAKGGRFGSELAAHPRYDVHADASAEADLEQIARMSAEAGGDILGNASVDVDEEALLGAYIRRFDGTSGATALERLANLQHRFDAYVDDRLLPVDRALPQTLAPEDLQHITDDDTVLLDLYLGRGTDGIAKQLAILSTKAHTDVVRHPNPGTGSIADVVGALREAVVQFTPVGVVDPGAEQQLAADADTFFGEPLLTALAAHHAAGRRHLRIVPHGPLHFYPLHLIGAPGASLADDWTITYLPNVQLARPLPTAPDGPKIAIGLSFANDPLLPPLTSSIAETVAVANIFGTVPLIDGAATKSSVLAALARARYLHLSTHGKHNVAAPAFQCLYVAGKTSAERLFAYELLALDLSGLEVVTLSACETALGRFDRGDNLRGLPASLLLAGAQAIVGTLWPVVSPATATFFPAFYAALEPGVRVRDAFRAAQTACRSAHPPYAHWGAFYLVDRTH